MTRTLLLLLLVIAPTTADAGSGGRSVTLPSGPDSSGIGEMMLCQQRGGSPDFCQRYVNEKRQREVDDFNRQVQDAERDRKQDEMYRILRDQEQRRRQ
jgi:hypothetical protein